MTKHAFVVLLGLLFAQAGLADKQPDAGLAGEKKKLDEPRLEATASTLYNGCYDSGSYAYCMGPIRNVNINQSTITFTLDLPGSEISKLSCAAGNTYANFYLGSHDNYNEMYEALRYAMAHNNYIRIGITGGAYNCTVTYMHAFPAGS